MQAQQDKANSPPSGAQGGTAIRSTAAYAAASTARITGLPPAACAPLLPHVTADCRSISLQVVLQPSPAGASMPCTETNLPALICFKWGGWHSLPCRADLALILTIDCRIEYTIEVMKGGASLEKRNVHAKDHYTFGRNPECDFHLEHPSISRVHAVLQYKAEGEHAVLAGSSAACPESSIMCTMAPVRGCSARPMCLCHTSWQLSALASIHVPGSRRAAVQG